MPNPLLSSDASWESGRGLAIRCGAHGEAQGLPRQEHYRYYSTRCNQIILRGVARNPRHTEKGETPQCDTRPLLLSEKDLLQ